MKTPCRNNCRVSRPRLWPTGMRRFLLSGLTGLALILPAMNSLWAQTDEMPTLTMDFNEIEAFLQLTEKNRRAALVEQANILTNQLALIVASESSLLEGYKNAYEAVVLNADRDKIQAWQQKSKALFESDGFVPALQLHVQYLIATLVKRLGNDEAALALTQKWISDFMGAGPKFKAIAQQPLITESVSQSLFLRAPTDALALKARHVTYVAPTGPNLPKKSPGPTAQVTAPASLLAELKQWYVGPLVNIPEVHRVNVIGYFRNNKNSVLFAEWKRNLNLEQELTEQKGSPEQQAAFLTNRRPWILWQIGKDYTLFDRPGAAANIMVMALKESPNCADYDKIVADIRRIIEESKQSSAPKPAALPAVSPRQSPSPNPTIPVSK